MKKFSRRLFIAAIFLSIAGSGIYGKKKKLVRRDKPLELMGLAEQRIAQNLKAEGLNICQIINDEDLRELVKSGVLIELTDNSRYFIDRGDVTKAQKMVKRGKGKKKTVISCIPKPNKVFVRPWVKEYLNKLAADYTAKFKKKLKITSGARTLKEQKLMRSIGSCYYTPYAAIASGPLEESLHVRGVVVDISSRKVMSLKEIRWMRKRLIEDKINGVEFMEENNEEPLAVEAEPIEENDCFHIAIFPKIK